MPARVTTKPCVVCNEMIDMDRDYRSIHCGKDVCVREMNWRRNLWRNHKMTPDTFYDMILQQNGCCPVCKETLILTLDNRKDGMNVDHDHSCCPTYRSCGNCIRGILCNGCNGGMGLFRDNPDFLIAAANYLKERNGC